MTLIRPLKAIRYKCLDCSAWNQTEVTQCEHKECILYELRYGKKPKNRKYEKIGISGYRRRIIEQ